MGAGNSKKSLKLLGKIDPTEVTDPINDAIVYAKVISCYDGDTCTIIIMVNNQPMTISLRLYGIDTAEKPRRKDQSDRTPEEIELCAAATQYLSDAVLDKCVMVNLKGWGKWGGRILGDLYTIDDKGNQVGESLSQQLLNAKLAVPYFGKKKDTDWNQVYKEWKDLSK